jgi:hypothetical protein
MRPSVSLLRLGPAMCEPQFAPSITSAGAMEHTTTPAGVVTRQSCHSEFILICLVTVDAVLRVNLSLCWECAPVHLYRKRGCQHCEILSGVVSPRLWFRVVASWLLLGHGARVLSECLSRNGWDVLRGSGLLCSISRGPAAAGKPLRLCLLLQI